MMNTDTTIRIHDTRDGLPAFPSSSSGGINFLARKAARPFLVTIDKHYDNNNTWPAFHSNEIGSRPLSKEICGHPFLLKRMVVILSLLIMTIGTTIIKQ